MSVSGIQFGGLASGLDTQAIIGALLAVEQRPIAQLETRRSNFQRQRSLLGDFEDLLSTLQEKADAIGQSDNFLAFSASSDDETVFTASAGSSALAGVYDIEVQTLASNEIRGSLGAADSNTTTYGTGTLTVNVGGTTTYINIEGGSTGNNTLDGIAAAINSSDAQVNAQVIDTGNGATPFQLVLTSEVDGSGGAVTLGADGASAALQTLVGEVNGNTIRSAADAEFKLNGVSVRRTTNSVSDLIQGVTLELRSTNPANQTSRLTIATDTEQTSGSVQEFVDAYNAVIDFVDNQNVVGEGGTASGPLFGDSTLRTVRSSLRDIVGRSASGADPSFSLLSQVGLDTDREGNLTFDSAEFAEKLTGNEDAVRALFTDASFGVATQIESRIDDFTDSVDGLFKARTDGFDRLIRDTNSQIERSERRLEQLEQQLTQRYANLEITLSRLQGQGGTLSSLPTPQSQ